MSDTSPAPVTTTSSEGALTARVDSAVFDRRAILTAAFGFVDRAYVSLAKTEGHVDVVLRPKGETPLDASLGAELEDALWAARLSGQLFAQGRDVVERVNLRALGTPEDELLELPPLTQEDLAAFEDPLGIAQSWEEKYAKDRAAAAPAGTAPESEKKEPPEDG